MGRFPPPRLGRSGRSLAGSRHTPGAASCANGKTTTVDITDHNTKQFDTFLGLNHVFRILFRKYLIIYHWKATEDTSNSIACFL